MKAHEIVEGALATVGFTTIVGIFENLNQASSIKMYILDIKVEDDTSDVLNYKETWTVHLEDENRLRHTIKVDIPKFYDKNFLWLSGNKKVIRNAEVIPAILYDCISKAFVPFKNSNGKKKLSIPQDAVIKKLLGLQTVEDMSTLNPFLELETEIAENDIEEEEE